VEIGFSLNVKAAERRPARIQVRGLIQVLVRVRHGAD
jgi:hypothetical protein